MASGAYTSTGSYKIGGAFSAYGRAVYDSTTGDTTWKWYSNELPGWVPNASTASGSAPTSESSATTVSNGASYYSDSGMASGTQVGTVTNTTFSLVVTFSNGSGTISMTSGTLYGGRYAASGTTLTYVATAASGRYLSSFLLNGTAITGSTHTFTADGSTEYQFQATFSYSTYSVSGSKTPTGGTIAVYKYASGAWQEVSTLPATASVGDRFKFVCTASSGYRYSCFLIGYPRGISTSATVEHTVTASSTSNAIAFEAVFVHIEAVTNTATSTTGGGALVYTSSGELVDMDGEGHYTAEYGCGYEIRAASFGGYALEGIYEGDTLLTRTSPYSYTQGGTSRTFKAVFVAKGEIAVTVYCGSTSAAATTTWNGCSCAKTKSGEDYTFTPSAASGYSFVKLYIEDLDGSGGGKVLTGSGSITTAITFNARVVAIFKDDDTPSEPADEDQGGSPTLSSAVVKEWEGGATKMLAVWKSRRNVFFKPFAASCARVYADGYTSSSPTLKILQYVSPNTQDVSTGSVSINITSQNAVRVPVRRSEKFVELEIDTNVQVLEASVSTSMEGLCRANT